MTQHRIIFGDSRDVLPTIEEGSVALVVTSPPYFVGRSYERYLEDEEDYWRMITGVLRRLMHIVEPFGKVAINFPDRYANSKVLGRPCEILYAHKFDSILSLYGFDLWARIIWDKNKVFIDGANHLANPQNKTGQMRVAPNWEYIFVWRKRSIPGPPPKKNVDMTQEERVAWTDSIWTFDSVTANIEEAGTKLALFPETLPYRLIKMYTEPGDIILDPFGGRGTVTKVAANLGRNSICIEKNPKMEHYIRNYLQPTQQDMFKDAEFEFSHLQVEEEDGWEGDFHDREETYIRMLERQEYKDNLVDGADYDYVADDLAFDAAREDRIFGRNR